MNQIYDSIIIGSGIAGMTAGIYLKRANLNILMLEKSIPGGQINRSALVENYPGFEKIDGPSLAATIFGQVKALEIPYQNATITAIEDQKEYKVVKTNKGDFQAKTIVIATGRKPRELGLENERKLTGRGISWCAICDGFFFKDQEVAVVGGGNSAFEEAIFLSGICKKVYLLNRSDRFRASEYFVEKIAQIPNIEIKTNTTVSAIIASDNKLDHINVITAETEYPLPVKGMFLYIGNDPDTSFLDGLVKTKNNYIVVNKEYQTTVPGIYACGDVIDKDLYQLSTAVGDAASAAYYLQRDYFS